MEIIEQHPVIDEILNTYHKALGDDLLPYSCHCYRVLNFVRFLGMREDDWPLMEVAIPFHDLGIWTHGTMDYLQPSVELALEYVKKHNLPVDAGHLETVIAGHHKLSAIENSSLAENFRKADLVDLTKGWLRCGIASKNIREVRRRLPDYRFQTRILQKVTVYALGHPFRPFPMLRR